jgi:hydrogenase maturation factor
VSVEAPGASCRGDAQQHCITCGDDGVVVRVLEADDATAICADCDGVEQTVAVELVSPVRVGDELLVHAGVAIRHLGVLA